MVKIDTTLTGRAEESWTATPMKGKKSLPMAAVPGCAASPYTSMTVIFPGGQLDAGVKGQYVEVFLPIQNACPAAFTDERWTGDAE